MTAVAPAAGATTTAVPYAQSYDAREFKEYPAGLRPVAMLASTPIYAMKGSVTFTVPYRRPCWKSSDSSSSIP